MSKRIFADKKDPLPCTDNGRTPNCYYHKLPITHFCVKKQCTLPLCDDCLPIHKKEHINNKQIAMDGVVEFERARGDALQAFEERKEEILSIQQKFRKKIQDYKSQIVDIVTNTLESVLQQCLATDGNLEILEEIEERTSEIRSGSLKELIRYYEDIFGAQHFRKLYKMYFGDYLAQFKYEVHANKIKQLVRSGIVSSTLRESNFNEQKQAVSPSIIENEELQITEPSASVKNFENLAPLTHHPEKKLIRETKEIAEEKSSFSLQKPHQRKQQQNIYTAHPATHPSDTFTSYPSHHTSNGSTSKEKRKKGLSLTKSHGRLPLETKQSFRGAEDHSQSLQNFERKNNWRKFINMDETNSRESHRGRETEACAKMKDQKLTIEQALVLNPREMRQLILKKKDESKSRGDKLRRQNKSIGDIPGGSFAKG